MHKISFTNGEIKKVIYAPHNSLLSNVLSGDDVNIEHPCGGRGSCKKCEAIVNGESVLSCQYKVISDIEVYIPSPLNIATANLSNESEHTTNNMCLCFDIGTTTLVLALVSLDEKRIIKSVTHNNPQRAFAADVMSRIDYATKNGVELLHQKVITELKSMMNELFESMNISHVNTLYVAGNTTMLHLFFGVSCSSMGYAPYTPAFLNSKSVPAESLGIANVDRIISIEGISAFVGADIVSGLIYVMPPTKKKYNLLIDLGTNAEVVLYSDDALYCTAAAAGPCFEGVNISCGMSATKGAIYSYSGQRYLTIDGGNPKGICATGLIDIVSILISSQIIDETGFMEDGIYEIADKISLTQNDIRQFQLAKSAIHSAVSALIKKAQITSDDIDKVFVSGGFSSKMNIGNAIKVGLFPKQFQGKIQAVNNSCLLGLVEYACEKVDTSHFLKNAEYVDLAKDAYFQDLFIENMMF